MRFQVCFGDGSGQPLDTGAVAGWRKSNGRARIHAIPENFLWTSPLEEPKCTLSSNLILCSHA